MARDAKEWEGDVRFVGVVPGPDTAVDEDAVRDVIDEYGLTFLQVRDRDLALTHRFGIEGTPTLLVLGKDACELYRGEGPPPDWGALVERSAE